MAFYIVLGSMNLKLGEIIIFDNSNDFPQGIRLIFTFGKNMAYKHMPFRDSCKVIKVKNTNPGCYFN